MELQYIVLTIIKILISVPAIVVLINQEVDAAALIGGHVKNNVSKINGINTTDSYDFKIDLTDENSQEYSDNSTEAGNSEEVPDPSPLIVPGYNLPENIFNRGKPFYLEKDPLTGSVDFDSKASNLKVYDDYEYEDEDLSYDKSQIDRKDGPISGVHKPSDINQLTPNFHDFLNLPVKYNPDKYVYPLISSSYANTKVQGNVNKQHNHKNYEITTYKPTLSPTYFTTKHVYSQNKVIEYGQKTKDKYNYEGTTKSYQSKNENTQSNLMHSPMNHPSFQEEYPNKGSSYNLMNSYEDVGENSQNFKEESKYPSSTYRPTSYYSSTTSRLDNRGPNLMHSPMNHPSFSDEYSISSTSTSKPITTTTVKTTTKRVMSLFEQLFGSDYDDTTTEADITTTTTTTAKPVPPKLFDNLPSNKKSSSTTQNVLVGNMGYVDNDDERPTTKKEMDEYEYYDYQDKYTSKEKYQTTTVSYTNNEKNPGSEDKYPTGLSNNEKYSTTFTNNEKYPTTFTNNEKYPTGYTNNEKYPSGYTNNDKYSTGFTPNEKYPIGFTNNQKHPTGFSNNENLPVTTNGAKYPNSEKYPTGSSSYNGKYPTASNGGQYEKYPTANEDSYSTIFTSNNGYSQASNGNKYSTASVNNNEKYPTTTSRRDIFETAATSSLFTTTTTTESPSTSQIFGNKKVTSLPLGENHVTHFHSMIASNNLREKLNAEKVVEQKYNSVVHPQAPSASNIHIAPDQDTVSFVVGNHQNVDGNEGNGGYVGTSLKESPYDNNPFRPVYNLSPTHEEAFRWTEAPKTTLNVQPARTTEPILILKEESGNHGNVDQVIVVENEYPSVGNKIVFPTERTTTYTPDLSPPPPPKQVQNILNREVLKLSSKPMFHQLPSDLTPPSETDALLPPRLDRDRERVRPPWDPRPGHFHAGRPEYARPPRPVQELYKRIDNLPNILPQFRPNMKVHHSHSHPHHHHHHHHQYQSKNYARQPLLDRPSNRPIGFFEKLHPPPLSKNEQKIIEDRMGMGTNKNHLQEPFAFLQAPPKVVVSNRRSGDDIETLQMIQAKKEKVVEPVKSTLTTNLNGKDTLEKPLYVVYPVNTPPLKLDVIDTNKKESVVIGTRAELPLPPSKISPEKTDTVVPNEFKIPLDFKKPTNDFKTPISSPEFNYELNERHDAPILKPRPGPFPVKTDFPYPLERPDPSILNPQTVEEIENNLPDEPVLVSSNQWNTIDDAQARIVNHNIQSSPNNQISVTLKTHTEKPIAVAYTPTESSVSKYTKEYLEAITNKNKYQEYHDRFSMPNYGGVVIPEIRPNSNPISNSEITVSAVMHARPQHQKIDRVDEDTTIPAQDFQAPFQASAHVDHSISQGWSVVKNKEEHKDEATTVPIATTSEFDIENFKPQLEGGFKPIYSFPEDQKDTLISERQE